MASLFTVTISRDKFTVRGERLEPRHKEDTTDWKMVVSAQPRQLKSALRFPLPSARHSECKGEDSKEIEAAAARKIPADLSELQMKKKGKHNSGFILSIRMQNQAL